MTTKKNLINGLNKTGYIIFIVVSLVVGTWNYLVSVATAFLFSIKPDFILFMGFCEAFFITGVAIIMMAYSIKQLRGLEIK